MSELRIARDLTQEEVAGLLGMELDAYGSVERGRTRLKADQAGKLADLYGVEIALLIGNQSRKIPVRGYVGAGAQVFPIDEGGASKEVDCPIGLNPNTTVALEVQGTSMYPFIGDGWIVFYTSEPHGPAEIIGQTCVVKVAQDGPTLLKYVSRSHLPGHYQLLSVNTAVPPIDALLEWASPIRDYQSPGVAKARPITD